MTNIIKVIDGAYKALDRNSAFGRSPRAADLMQARTVAAEVINGLSVAIKEIEKIDPNNQSISYLESVLERADW